MCCQGWASAPRTGCSAYRSWRSPSRTSGAARRSRCWFYSAALSDIPLEIEEAAQVDGASGWRRLVSITLPMIRRSIMTNLMLITLQTLSVFGLIFTMTRGGPGTKSQTLPLYMYEQAFSFGNLGYGTAIAIMLL